MPDSPRDVIRLTSEGMTVDAAIVMLTSYASQLDRLDTTVDVIIHAALPAKGADEVQTAAESVLDLEEDA
jgi:hypothetical protein